ncbi:alpha,alpha-trehalose-phosphate synthase (UDP-forming) [Chitinasiproducens palmae]|uniref:Trehalose-6-phosphate synthase n=1 Tax=Chitinasiproducens palmae TaxID=1770053 RepID=A0A1H2PPA6_9BURK|nr:alpha,alpha-trehalose-phosphate synthase (UDP-forming) [Chitinasiproducens palmae]SDV47715.1 trehalose 6-phosphate synthase [Chitinasiproducens palmae]
MSRLVVVSNRVAAVSEAGPAAGGLAIGVLDALKETGGVWFGWSGECLAEASDEPTIETRGNVTYATVSLAKRDYDQYYRGFSNATLWPVFHYRNDLARYDRQEYAGYQRVNRWLAAQLKPLLRPDDVIWVHDYHLIPFAAACRELGIENPIGFFLHIPFPVPQILFTVPPHAELIQALMQYDLVGFQTRVDMQAFLDYVVRAAGGQSDGRSATLDGRTCAVGAFPIGVYPDAIAKAAKACAERKVVRALRDSLHGRALVISVDRLDYSKGLVERFHAFEALLAASPGLHGRVSLLQIAPPTRSDVQSYQLIRRTLEAESGRINGRYAQLDWTPIQYLNRKYERNLLMALLRTARVGCVTPLRDGMNLVAKEYVAAQDPTDPGVLVLSQFAGAAEEMPGALVVNPFNVMQTAEAIERALTMPLDERIQRHASMMAKLRESDLSVWRDAFLNALADAAHVALPA